VAVAVRQYAVQAGPPLGLGQTLTFPLTPLANSRLLMFAVGRSTGDPTPGPTTGTGWTRIGAAYTTTPSNNGAGGAWTKVASGLIGDKTSVWDLGSQMVGVTLIELTGVAAALGNTAQTSNAGTTTTSPDISALPGALAGLAIAHWTHAGGTHFDAGNAPNGDYSGLGGWTELEDINTGPSHTIASKAYGGGDPAVHAQYLDFSTFQGTWGGTLVLVEQSAGGVAFHGEPGGGVW
jgi:hypothetical protein